MSTATMTIEGLVDLDRYPIHDPANGRYREAVAEARSQLAATGCALNKDFVRPEALELFAREINERKPQTHFSRQDINPYFHTEINAGFPAGHPVNTFLERSSGFIPGDAWGAGCANDTLFRAPEVAAFLAYCLQIRELHCYAAPLAGLTSNILDAGQLFTWHFDTNEFAVTLLVQEADEGGLFEYVPDIRSVADESFDAIAHILAGRRDGVVSLDLRPGDLQVFKGRYALHRVTRVASDSRSRHAAIFAYTEQPNVIGRVERTQQLFGRVLQEHVAAEASRVRGDDLLD